MGGGKTPWSPIPTQRMCRGPSAPGVLGKIDIFPNETIQYDHVILPAASFAEKDGTPTDTKQRVQRVGKAFASPGKARLEMEAPLRSFLAPGLSRGDLFPRLPSTRLLHRDSREIMERLPPLFPAMEAYLALGWKKEDPMALPPSGSSRNALSLIRIAFPGAKEDFMPWSSANEKSS